MREGDKQKQRRLALQRIDTLFGQVDTMPAFDKAVADRLITRIWSLCTKNRIRLPLVLRRRFCRKCKTYWLPGRTVRIRIVKGKKIYTCLSCGTIKRVPFK